MSADLLEFNADWISNYRDVVNSFKSLEINGIIAIYHIGGTSVRMKAHPIIDVMIVFASGSDLQRGVTILSNHGFAASEEKCMTGLFFLRRPAGTIPEVNLYTFENGNPHISRLLFFRNHLRENAETVTEYEAVRSVRQIDLTVDEKRLFIKNIDRITIDAHEGPLTHSEVSADQLHSDMISQDIMRRLADNLFFEMTYFAYFNNATELNVYGPITVVTTGLPSDLYNYILNPSPRVRNKTGGDIRDEAIRTAIDLMDLKKVPFCIWSGPNSLSEIRDPRVAFKGSYVGMYLDLTRAPRRSIHSSGDQLVIENIRNVETLQDFDDVHVSCGLPLGAFQTVFRKLPDRLLGEDSPLQCFVGYLGTTRQPVVSGLLCLHACIAGLYYVLVSPQHRDIGIGDQMINHMLTMVRGRGYRYVTLVADQTGQKVYETHGFVSACSFRKYGRK